MFSLNLAVFFCAMVTMLNAGPLATIKRNRRNNGNNGEIDKTLSESYWFRPVELGVFVNSDADNSETLNKRTVISDRIAEGSGSGSGITISEPGKRSKVPKPVFMDNNEEEKKHETFQAEKKSELSANVSHIEEMSDDEATKKTTTITCQGQKDWLQCPMYRLIKINSAFWGRDDTKSCLRSGIEHGLKTSEICAQDESNTMAKVQNACEGESACELVASPVYFDRTDCPDIYKFMRVTWECAHSEARIKETIEEEREEVARHKADQA